MKQETLIIRIDKATKDKLKKAALENRRSMSNYVLLLIEDALKNKRANN